MLEILYRDKHLVIQSFLINFQKTGILNSIKKYSKKISRKPDKLLFDNTNILYAYAKEYKIEVDIGTLTYSPCLKAGDSGFKQY